MSDMLWCPLASDGVSYFVTFHSLNVAFRRCVMIIQVAVCVSIQGSLNSFLVTCRYSWIFDYLRRYVAFG